MKQLSFIEGDEGGLEVDMKAGKVTWDNGEELKYENKIHRSRVGFHDC